MEKSETIARRVSLYNSHALSGASFEQVNGWLLPAYYTNAVEENLVVRSRVGLVDLSWKGYLKISGSDRASFLQGITTNDVASLKTGGGQHGALLTVKGRVVADFILLAFDDHFLLETETSATETLQTALSRYKIREKVNIELIPGVGSLGVQGPLSTALIAKAIKNPPVDLKPYHHINLQLAEEPITLRRQSTTGEEGYIITMTNESLRQAWQMLRETGVEFNLQPVGYESSESLRIEAGLPRYGLDITEENIPLEISGEDMISYTKGCFVGQEVVARVKNMGQANKFLKGLLLAESAPPHHNSRVIVDGKDIGWITSSAYSPTLKQTLAMAYIRREFSATDALVSIESDGKLASGRVTDLPFIKR